MAEKTTPPTGQKKGKKKLSTAQKVGLYAGGAVLVYLGYRYYQNNAANSAATTDATNASGIDPLTGQPYAAGVGSLANTSSSGQAIDPATGQPYASELATATQNAGIDPTTGQPYSSELATAQQAGIDPTTGQPYSSELGTWTSDIAAGVNPVTGLPFSNTTVTTGNGGEASTLAQWRAAQVAALTRNGVDAKTAGQQVALYLEGKPLTDLKAYQDLTNRLPNAPAPVTTPPTLRLSATVTKKAVAPSHAAAVSHPVHAAAPKVVAPKAPAPPVHQTFGL